MAKGNETVEYACSLPQLAQGTTLRVSSQVTCQDKRVPVGVIASIVPFNFPRKYCIVSGVVAFCVKFIFCVVRSTRFNF